MTAWCEENEEDSGEKHMPLQGERHSVSCLRRQSEVTGTLPCAARAVAWIAVHERQLSIPFHLNVECWECSLCLNCVPFTSPTCHTEGVCHSGGIEYHFYVQSVACTRWINIHIDIYICAF